MLKILKMLKFTHFKAVRGQFHGYKEMKSKRKRLRCSQNYDFLRIGIKFISESNVMCVRKESEKISVTF